MDWEARLADLWASLDDHDTAAFRAKIETLAAELPEGSPVADFERASAWDSTGHSDRAVEAGLDGLRRRRATIQLASSLRNLGQAAESAALLTAERVSGSDDLDDAVDAFLALALTDLGREREAAALALTALSRHMTRYRRSLASYAGRL
jgi:hypothetical protein